MSVPGLSAIRWQTPLCLDALLMTVLVHFGYVLTLRLTGWSTSAHDWATAPREPEWWLMFFSPAFLIILLPAYFCRRWRRAVMLFSTIMVYLFCALCLPVFSA